MTTKQTNEGDVAVGASDRATTRAEDRQRMAEEIEHDSPEGRPAHPEAGPIGIGAIMIGGAVVVVLAGIAGALLLDPEIGVVIAVLGLLLLVVNPETWASALRARERARTKHRVDQDRAQQRGRSDERSGEGRGGPGGG